MGNKFTEQILPAIILTFIVVCVACVGTSLLRKAVNAKPGTIRIENDRQSVYYKEVTIDGCQYIIRGQGICHKGNCTNHIQHAERP